ncbi:SA1002 family membrane protein [Bacillus sp. C1]
MYTFFYLTIIGILLIFIGYLTYNKLHLHKVKTYIISLFFLVFLCIASLFLIIMLAILLSIFVNSNFGKIEVDSIVYLSFMAILLTAIALFYFIHLFGRFVDLSTDLLEVAEYFIQWTTIYLTLYQLFFGVLINGESSLKNIFSNFDNPDYVVFSLLISLLSVWIAVVMHKIRITNSHK